MNFDTLKFQAEVWMQRHQLPGEFLNTREVEGGAEILMRIKLSSPSTIVYRLVQHGWHMLGASPVTPDKNVLWITCLEHDPSKADVELYDSRGNSSLLRLRTKF